MRSSLLAVALVAALALASAGSASSRQTAAPPRVTVAGIDPSLVAGRGAQLGIVEQEAENADTNGAVLPFDTSAYTLSGEASGRQAVKLTPGQYVAFTLTAPANAVTIRYALPDAPTGGGIDAPLVVGVDHNADGLGDSHPQTITLTSKYSYLYNLYPFTNDPNAGILHPDWWVTECQCVPGTAYPSWLQLPYRPMHFYDEQRVLLGHTYKAGAVVRVTMPSDSNAAWTVIDLADFQDVAPPAHRPDNSVSVTEFGADPTGQVDSADAFDRAVQVAQARNDVVWIPAGTFQVDRHIIVDHVTIEGAGSWYSIVKGHQVTLSTPAPDGSIHTGVGFYGKPASEGGSHDVHLADFAIEGDVRERIDTDQVNGVGGAFNDSTIDGLYIHHTKVGIWLDGPMDNLTISNAVIADQIADGINFHQGVTNSKVVNTLVRNTGDDGLAMWSQAVPGQPQIENSGDVFDHDTVMNPVLANAIAIYGGRDNTASDDVVADPVREGSGLHAGQRFGSTPFAGYLRFVDNTTVRAAPFELNWRIGLGAIWLYALDGSIGADVEVSGDNFLQNTYNAILIVSDYSVRNLYSISNVHFSNIHVDGTGTSVLSARSAGNATFEDVQARNVGAVGINNCGAFNFTPAGSEFSVTDLGGNTGGGTTGPWMAPWELPNTITCDDRPPVVPPPPPSAW
jgi:Alpha-1,3-glucanase catalytic domain D1/Alpha-1,3-glucanase catalytic domain D2